MSSFKGSKMQGSVQTAIWVTAIVAVAIVAPKALLWLSYVSHPLLAAAVTTLPIAVVGAVFDFKAKKGLSSQYEKEAKMALYRGAIPATLLIFAYVTCVRWGVSPSDAAYVLDNCGVIGIIFAVLVAAGFQILLHSDRFDTDGNLQPGEDYFFWFATIPTMSYAGAMLAVILVEYHDMLFLIDYHWWQNMIVVAFMLYIPYAMRGYYRTVIIRRRARCSTTK